LTLLTLFTDVAVKLEKL